MIDNRVMKIITVILWSLVVIAASALIIVVNRMQGVQSATVTPDLSVPAMQGKAPVANGDGTISSDADGVYCYDSHDDQLTGWQRIDGERYYFDPANGGKAATGWTWIDGLKYYFDEDNHLVQDVDKLIGHQSSYYLTVNCETQTVMVYAQDKPGGEYNIPVRAMVCSTGGPGNETIQGTFPISKGERWGTLFNDDDYVYGQYVSIISGNYLFHSCWYYRNGDADSLSVSAYNKLGTACSHGCVRMSVADCKWVWENCAGNNSTVKIYSADETSPFDRPEVIPAVAINGDMGRDPTDDCTEAACPTEPRVTETWATQTYATEPYVTEARTTETYSNTYSNSYDYGRWTEATTTTTYTYPTQAWNTQSAAIDPLTGEPYGTWTTPTYVADPYVTEPYVTEPYTTYTYPDDPYTTYTTYYADGWSTN